MENSEERSNIGLEQNEKLNKEVTFYIVRHAQTEMNVGGYIQGWVDSPLTEDGIKKTEKIAKELAKIPFSVCACSTLSRAVVTLKSYKLHSKRFLL